MTETFFYQNQLYTWHHEPQNLYSERHISIQDAVRVINRDPEPTIQQEFDPPRWKFIGNGTHTMITVITEDDWLTIVTEWNSSTTE